MRSPMSLIENYFTVSQHKVFQGINFHNFYINIYIRYSNNLICNIQIDIFSLGCHNSMGLEDMQISFALWLKVYFTFFEKESFKK